MKPNFLAKLGATLLVLGGLPAHSQTLNWGSVSGTTMVDSEGAALDTAFLYQLGTFEAGFVPTEENLSHWDGAFRVFDVAGYYDTEEDGTGFTSTVNLQEHQLGDGEGTVYDYPIFEGMRAYIMIRNRAGTEIFLASASNWIFPTKSEGCCPTGVSTDWSISNLGTDSTPIWGSVSGPFFDHIQTQAIPEPGSVLLTLAASGLVFVRRRRNS